MNTRGAKDPVRFGLSLPNLAVLWGMPVGDLIAAAETADARPGFDSVWVGDNLLSNPRLEGLMTLAGIATRTRRVKLGTVCLASFPLRNPILLAIQWASLDILSGGRTILAVSIGGAASRNARTAAELATLGIRSVDRVARMREGLEILRRCWGPDPVSFEGRFYRIDGVNVQPKPVQARVPVIIAVNPPPGCDPAVEERALRRVARLADGWQTDDTTPETFRARWERIRTYAAEVGRGDMVTDASYHLMVNINDDREAAFQGSFEFLDRYYGRGRMKPEVVRSWLAGGPPEEVISKIAAFVEAGCTTLILRFTSTDQLGQIRRCVEEVLPAFDPGRSSA